MSPGVHTVKQLWVALADTTRLRYIGKMNEYTGLLVNILVLVFCIVTMYLSPLQMMLTDLYIAYEFISSTRIRRSSTVGLIACVVCVIAGFLYTSCYSRILIGFALQALPLIRLIKMVIDTRAGRRVRHQRWYLSMLIVGSLPILAGLLGLVIYFRHMH